MEVSIPFSIFISATGIIVSIAIFMTKANSKLDQSLALQKVNDERHANPEKSGIGTNTTNQVIEHLTDLMGDIKNSNRDQSRGLLEVIKGTNDHIVESTKATERLITLIELKLP